MSVPSFLSVQYLQMLRSGVIPIPPDSKPIFGCSPVKVKSPFGPSIFVQSPLFMEFRVSEKVLPVSFFVNSRWSVSVGLLEMVKCFLRVSPFAFLMLMNMNCPAR